MARVFNSSNGSWADFKQPLKGIFNSSGGSAPIDPDAQAWFTAAAASSLTPFSATFQAAGNTLILGLKAANLFSLLTALYTFNVEVFNQELVNAVAPANFLMTPNGGLTLTPLSGISSNGTTGYYNTNFSFTSGMQTAFSIGAIVVANSDTQSAAGTSTNANIISIFTKGANAGVDALMRVAQSNQCNWTNAVGEGHFAASRAAAVTTGFQDGVQKVNLSATNLAPDGSTILWMRRTTSFTAARLGVGWFATSALSATDIGNLHTLLTNFLAAA